MKKIVKLSIIFWGIWIALLGNVYAVTCNVELKLEDTNITKGEEFVVYFNVSEIESDRGIISLTATLEYDKDNLILIKMEGKNGWETPTEEISYTADSGKMAINRSGLGKNDETILALTFKAKDNSSTSGKIKLKNVTIADGNTPAKFEEIETVINIKHNTTQSPIEQPTDNTIKEENVINEDNTIKEENSIDVENQNTTFQNNTIIQDNTMTSDSKLPQTGENINIIAIAIIVLIILVTIRLYIKMRLLVEK